MDARKKIKKRETNNVRPVYKKAVTTIQYGNEKPSPKRCSSEKKTVAVDICNVHCNGKMSRVKQKSKAHTYAYICC